MTIHFADEFNESEEEAVQLSPEEIMQEEMAVERQFILDSAPDDWEDEIDHSLVEEYKADIALWSTKEILAFSKNNYIWSDPTYAKALLEVIGDKIKK